MKHERKAAMTISELKRAIMLCRHIGVTPFIWGVHGIGKSSIIYQLGEEHHLGIVDFRLGQCEASDVRGIADRDTVRDRTRFLPPEEFPSATMTWEEYQKQLDEAAPEERSRIRVRCQPLLKEGIVFLDEPNRAEDDVLQAVFQLVWDRRIGLNALPDGWSVACAGNFADADYIVNTFNDPAFIDRFCHMILSPGEPTFAEWSQHMAGIYGDAAVRAVQFTAQELRYLDGDVKAELNFSITPSRRSWENVIKAELVGKQHGFSDDDIFNVISGLVGLETAHSYKNYSSPILPSQLLQDGVARHEETIKGLNRGQVVGLMWGLVSYLKERINKDERADKVALDFAVLLAGGVVDRDLAVAFCRSIISQPDESASATQLRTNALTNKHMAKLYDKAIRDRESEGLFRKMLNHDRLRELLTNVSWEE